MEITDLTKRAISVKAHYLKVMTSAELLVKRVKCPSGADKELLGWANNSSNVGVLEKHLATCKSKVNDFADIF